MSDNWVVAYTNDLEFMADLDGVSWHEAPLPRRFHRCRPQTRGLLHGVKLERCACGAMRVGGLGLPWLDRNSRRARKR